MTWWIVNAIGATLAVPANLWSTVGATPTVQRMKFGVASIAATYSIGIWWGVLTDRIDDWAKVGRVVGSLAWVCVWIWPPIAARRDRERLAARIEGLRDPGSDRG